MEPRAKRDEPQKKKGRQFVYSESFMEALGCCHAYLHLPFRQTEGLIKSHLKGKTKTPTYCAIWKRVSKLDIKMNPRLGKDIVIAIDRCYTKSFPYPVTYRYCWA